MRLGKLSMNLIERSFYKQRDITFYSKCQQQVLAKRFFPSYMTKIKYVVNALYDIHPRLSFLLIIKLLSVAIRGKLSRNAKVFYKSGLKKQFIVEGSTFFTYTFGNGPVILMLHGWCSNGARWRVYVKDLVNSGYRVVVVDAPGHGAAPGRFLSVFHYTKGIKVILESETKWHTIITHSIAGLCAMAALGKSDKKHHPSKFIMMNTFANVTRIFETFSCCLGISRKVVEGAIDMMSKSLEFPIHELNIAKHYQKINAKCLLIYDTDDKVVPRCEADYLINEMKSLTVVKTEGLGHNLKSHDVVKQVLTFVNRKMYDTLSLEKIALCK